MQTDREELKKQSKKSAREKPHSSTNKKTRRKKKTPAKRRDTFPSQSSPQVRSIVLSVTTTADNVTTKKK